jgi:hypothetical protein
MRSIIRYSPFVNNKNEINISLDTYTLFLSINRNKKQKKKKKKKKKTERIRNNVCFIVRKTLSIVYELYGLMLFMRIMKF